MHPFCAAQYGLGPVPSRMRRVLFYYAIRDTFTCLCSVQADLVRAENLADAVISESADGRWVDWTTACVGSDLWCVGVGFETPSC